MDRKQELEKKRQKLSQLREENRRKEESKVASANTGLRTEAEDLLKGLGLDNLIAERKIIDKISDTKIDTPLSNFENKKAKLKITQSINSVDITPRETVLYSKESQTNTEIQPRDNNVEDNSFDYYVPSIEWDDEDLLVGKEDLLELSKFSNIPPLGKTKKSSGKGKNIRNALHLGPDTEDFEELREQPAVPTLTEEERNQILQSDGFLSFFNRSAKIVERAVCLNEDTHLFIRYDGGDGETDFQESNDLISFAVNFHDDHWSKHRAVTSLDWSPTFPELMLASYHSNEYSQHEPEGVCLIWNMRFQGKMGPEYCFTSQSPVTSACFSKFHPNLVIAGTYSGQIVLWDTRSNKRTPSQKTSLAPTSHTHRVFSVQVLGTQNAHNIVSVANDGSLRNWSIENLSQPTDSAKVLDGATSGGLYDIFPTCLSFFANDLNNYAIGAENGNAYTEQRHSSRSGNRSEPIKHSPYTGHTAPVTSIHCHPNSGESIFSHLFLTSSLDWTTRLWSVRDQKPVHTFGDSFECVYDVQWSPVNPGLFATADGNGQLNIWDISTDFEVPAVSRKIGLYGDETTNEGHSQSHMNSGKKTALSKCRWDISGSLLATGDINGRVHVYNVNENLAKPKQTSWSDLTSQLGDMKSLSADVDSKSSYVPMTQTVSS